MHNKKQKEFDEAKDVFNEVRAEVDSYHDYNENEDRIAEPMSDSQIVSYINDEISRGVGGEDNTDYNNIALAYDYYLGRLPGISKQAARDPKASRFISMDVMDTIEATVAEIMPTFMTKDLAFYEPENDRDEDQAKAESDLVNYMFFEECDGYTVLQTALRDALLNRNCSAKVFWDIRNEVQYEAYENVNVLALFELLQPTTEGEIVEIIEQEAEGEEYDSEHDSSHDTEYADEGEHASKDENAEDDTVVEIDPSVTYTIRLKRTRRIEKPVVEGVAPEQIIVTAGHLKPTLYDVRFVAHEMIETQSSLIAQGFDPKVVSQLEDYNTATNIEAQARSRVPEENNYYSTDDSTRYIRIYECYVMLDVDGDGIAERRKIVFSQDILLSNDPWDGVAIVGGVTTAISHKYLGVSLFDRIKDIQDSKTPVLRSIINGTQLASNPRIGVVTGEVNIDDLLTSRTGGTIRVTNPNSMFDAPKAEVPQSSYTFLDMMDNLRRERGGSAVDTSATAQKIQSDTAHAFERTMASMELSNALLARTFAETLVKGIFTQFHQVIRENYKGELKAKISGKWITSVPEDWKTRTAVTISIGASNAERARLAAAMEKIISLQATLAQSGSVMFDEGKSYKAIINAISLSGIKNPETYFVDPNSEEGQQKSEQNDQQQQEMSAKEDELQAAMAKAQTDMAQAEMAKGQAALTSQQVTFENNQLKAELDELKTMMKSNDAAQQLELKRDQMHVDEALRLTQMEIQANKDVSAQNKENKTEE